MEGRVFIDLSLQLLFPPLLIDLFLAIGCLPQPAICISSATFIRLLCNGLGKVPVSDQKLLALTPDPKLPQSARVQFLQKLKIAVSSGYWKPAEALPDAIEFSEMLGIDRQDAQIAIDELVETHWLQHTDTGLHITPKIDQPVSCVASLSDNVESSRLYSRLSLAKPRSFQCHH